MTVAFLVGACCLWVGNGVEPAPAQAAGWQVQRLTDNDILEYDCGISGDRVVWAADEPGDSEILLLDVVTGHLTRVTDNTVQDEQPSICGDNVAWSRFEGTWRVVLWDAERDTRSVIGGGILPSVDDSHVVWEGDSGSSKDILLYRIASGATTTISSNPLADERPRLSSGSVVWERYVGGLAGDVDIELYDIASGQRYVVTADSVEDSRPDTDGSSVVWSRYDGADLEIMRGVGRPLVTSLPLTNNAVGDYGPVVSGRRLAWMQDAGTVESNVLVQDLRTGASSSLTATPVMLESLDIDGPRVVWTAWDGSDNEVYLASYSSFSDVPPTYFNYFAIQSLSDDDVVGGYPDGTFRPDSPVWRAQFAKMIVGALDVPVSESMTAPFDDVGPDDPTTLYPHDYIAAAAQHGITRGTTARTFDPWGDITRAQVVTMVVRGATLWWGVPTPALPPDFPGTFGDFDPTHGYNMRLAEYLGLLNRVQGFGPSWDPWAPASRAELSQILWEARDRLKP